MSATTSALADLIQTDLNEGNLGYRLLETALDGNLDPESRAVVRALVRVWSCGDYAYFGLSPHRAVKAAQAVTA